MPKGVAGYNAALYVTGATTATTDEACSELSDTVFRITDAAKRILAVDVAVVVKANTVVQSDNYELDYNFGTVTFTDGSHTGESVTITASYLPRHQISKLKNARVESSLDVADSTALGDSAQDLTPTVRRARIAAESMDAADADIYGTTSLADIYQAETPVVFEVQELGAGEDVTRVRTILNERSINPNGPGGLLMIDLGTVGTTDGGTLISHGPAA